MAELVTHILKEGRPLCGKEGVPSDWGPFETYVAFNDADALELANCRRCRASFMGLDQENPMSTLGVAFAESGKRINTGDTIPAYGPGGKLIARVARPSQEALDQLFKLAGVTFKKDAQDIEAVIVGDDGALPESMARGFVVHDARPPEPMRDFVKAPEGSMISYDDIVVELKARTHAHGIMAVLLGADHGRDSAIALAIDESDGPTLIRIVRKFANDFARERHPELAEMPSCPDCGFHMLKLVGSWHCQCSLTGERHVSKERLADVLAGREPPHERKCPHCGFALQLHGIEKRPPKAGDITVCPGCFELLSFDTESTPRVVTDEDRKKFPPAVLAVLDNLIGKARAEHRGPASA